MAPTKPDNARIGRYEVLRKIATGGMAELFVAKHVGMDGFEKVVALKRILSHLAFDEEFIAMFRDEARLVAKLNHPHIVQIYDLGKSDDSYFIAMEYIAGRNLSSIAKKARTRGESLPPVNIARCLAQACEGLYYAHTRKDAEGRGLEIIHRDVSPQNIIVSFSGSVKLVDFGIAKAASKVAHTRTGVLKGKYAYMSPEQIRGTSPIDARSDLFAVGIVLYELLCGRRPFEKDTSMQTLKAIVQEEPVPCRELNPEIPEGLAAIIHRCLEKNKNRRYASAQEVQVDLEDFVSGSRTRCNSITISHWLSSLFDGELSRENGGTVVFKGVGEVILPDVPNAPRPPIPAPSNRLLEAVPAPSAEMAPERRGIDANDLLEEFTLDRPLDRSSARYSDDSTVHTGETDGPDLSSSGVVMNFDAESSDLDVDDVWHPDTHALEDEERPGEATIALPKVDHREEHPEGEDSLRVDGDVSGELSDLLRDLEDDVDVSPSEAEADATLAMPPVSDREAEVDQSLTADELAALYDGVAEDDDVDALIGDPTVGVGGQVGGSSEDEPVWGALDDSGGGAVVTDPPTRDAWNELEAERTLAPSQTGAVARGPRTDRLPPEPLDERTLDGVISEELAERVVEPTARPRRRSSPVAAIALERREVPLDGPNAVPFEPNAAFEPEGQLSDLFGGDSATDSDAEAQSPHLRPRSHQDEYSALVAPASPLPRESVRPADHASSSRLQALPSHASMAARSAPSISRSVIGRQIREVVRSTSQAGDSSPRIVPTPVMTGAAPAYPTPSPAPVLTGARPFTLRSRLLTAAKTALGVVALAAATYAVLLYLLPPEPLLEVATDPPGATLRLNGALIPGQTPITLRLEPGVAYRLQLEREGYQTVADEVSVAPDQGRTSYRVQLQPRP